MQSSGLQSLFAPIAFALSLLLAAPSLLAKNDDSLIPPLSKDKAVAAYQIAVTDLLSISIYQEPDLQTTARVDAKGNIHLPLVGDVPVVGLTVDAAQKTVKAAYQNGQYLRDPQVNIGVQSYAAREVSISGQIASPGRYPLPVETNMTVLDLVTKAGGFTDTAKGTAVTITRITPDGKQQVFTIDVASLLHGDSGANIRNNSLVLQPGDIVFVPQRIF